MGPAWQLRSQPDAPLPTFDFGSPFSAHCLATLPGHLMWFLYPLQLLVGSEPWQERQRSEDTLAGLGHREADTGSRPFSVLDPLTSLFRKAAVSLRFICDVDHPRQRPINNNLKALGALLQQNPAGDDHSFAFQARGFAGVCLKMGTWGSAGRSLPCSVLTWP